MISFISIVRAFLSRASSAEAMRKLTLRNESLVSWADKRRLRSAEKWAMFQIKVAAAAGDTRTSVDFDDMDINLSMSALTRTELATHVAAYLNSRGFVVNPNYAPRVYISWIE